MLSLVGVYVLLFIDVCLVDYTALYRMHYILWNIFMCIKKKNVNEFSSACRYSKSNAIKTIESFLSTIIDIFQHVN